MQIDKTYNKIIQLDDEEKIGYSYYCHTGKYLNYIDLKYLLKFENPYDFSVLKTKSAADFREITKNKLDKDLSGALKEQMFIQNNSNSEIQHLPRYIDIFAHRHDFFEIVCTTKGECFHKVEDKEVIMKQGDITIIPPNVKHYLRAEYDCVTLTIKIRKSTFDRVFSSLICSGTTLSAYFTQTLYSKHYRNSLTFNCGQDAFLPELLLYMFSQQTEKKKHYNYVLDGLLATFFPYLVQNFEDTIELSVGDNIQNGRITEIESYMRQNYKTATLSETAKHFFLNPSYLSTTIKKQTGYTFSSIMQRIRMEHAAQLLTETSIKVEQICENVGYQDTTQFIRTFKKYYNTTPYRYRKEFNKKLETSLIKKPSVKYNNNNKS